MPKKATRFQTFGAPAPQPKKRDTAAARGYGYQWQKAREGYLRAHPLCVACKQLNRIRAASVVDHIVPHRGDSKLFWDSANWQALCKPCHDAKTGSGR